MGTAVLNITGAAYDAPSLTVNQNGTLNISGAGSFNISGVTTVAGGVINQTGGTFTSSGGLVVANGYNKVQFGANYTVPQITINANAELDTVNAFVVKAGQILLAGTGNASSLIDQRVTSTVSSSTVSMADGAVTTLGT